MCSLSEQVKDVFDYPVYSRIWYQSRIHWLRNGEVSYSVLSLLRLDNINHVNLPTGSSSLLLDYSGV